MWCPGVPCEFWVSSVNSAPNPEENMSSGDGVDGRGTVMREVNIVPLYRLSDRHGEQNARKLERRLNRGMADKDRA